MFRTALLGLLSLVCALPVVAQQYADRPLTMLSGYPAGGQVDLVARILAEAMKGRFPKGVVVAIRSGAGGAIAAQPGEAKPFVEAKKMRALVGFQEARHPAFPDAPTAKELGWNVANGVWFLLMAPKGTPAPALKYIHDAAKAAIEDPGFVNQMSSRGIDVDYRPGDKLRADLWREFKAHTEVLRRIGMIKQ